MASSYQLFDITKQPLQNVWSVSISKSKSLDQTVEGLFENKLQISFSDFYLEQLYTFSKEEKIIIAYFILVPGYKAIKGKSEEWINIKDIKKKYVER